MEVRFESMVCLWDDKIPTMFLEFMNLLTFCQSEEQLRASVKDFAEKHELPLRLRLTPFLHAPTLHKQSRNGDAEQSFVSTFLTI